MTEFASPPAPLSASGEGESSRKALSLSQKLRAAQDANHSWLCVGLDPSHTERYGALIDFCYQIIGATADVASAYKLNLGFFLAHGSMGLDALAEIVRHIPKAMPILLDAKFGDIGNSAEHYARFAFERVHADAVTLNPYIGSDSLRAFLTNPYQGIFAVCRTSNIEGNEFQTLSVGGKPLYQHVAAEMAALGEQHPGKVGLVVGATQPEDMRAIRQTAPKLPFLIPGVGAQGGDLEAAVRYGATADGLGPVINVGRAIIYASEGDDFAQVARAKAVEYRAQINVLRAKYA